MTKFDYKVTLTTKHKPKTLTETGKGQNYEFHNVENQKEHRKSWRRSLHRKDL